MDLPIQVGSSWQGECLLGCIGCHLRVTWCIHNSNSNFLYKIYHPRPIMACAIVRSLPAIHVLGICIPHARTEVGGDTYGYLASYHTVPWPHPGHRRGPWALEQSAQWLSSFPGPEKLLSTVFHALAPSFTHSFSTASARAHTVPRPAPLTPVTWLHHGSTLWACALYDKMANPTHPLAKCAVLTHD